MISLTGRNISFVLLIWASILLPACGSTEHSKSSNISTQPTPQKAIIKSPIDDREYEILVLPNQMQMLLVSDPSIEKSAVAVSVAVGSFQDPEEVGGLAHYLEHVLLLGSKNYPDEGAYHQFVSAHGGQQNAYTELDHTNYMLSVNNTAFDQALARFSDFLYQASLEQKSAEKERLSVNAEWSMQAINDWVILERLNGLTLQKAHPVSQFSWGNLQTLVDSNGQTLHGALLNMYHTYYSANLMKGAMISHLPVADMKKLARKHFAKVPNKNTPRPQVMAKVAKPENLKKIVHYIPQANMQQLRINFVIQQNAAQFAVKPNGYVSYLLENEMPGSLASVLRDAGLSEAVYTSYDADYFANAGSFSLFIDLTEQGVQQRDGVMAAVIKYLSLLRKKGVKQEYFEEIQQSLSNSFRFQEKTDDYTYAMQIAATLQHTPAEYVLSRAYEYQRFHPVMTQAVLDQFTIDNARIFYIDPSQQADTEMEHFPGRYRISAISAELEQKWLALGDEFAVNLPSANNLMPENFTLVEPVFTDMPKQLITAKTYSIHLGHSALFKQPKGIVVLDLNSDITRRSAKQHMLANMFSRAIHQQTLKLQTEAYVAGMGLNLSLSNGLVITLSGFTDKQRELLTAVLQLIAKFSINNIELANLKVSLRAAIKNRQHQDYSSQSWQQLKTIITLDEYSDKALLQAIEQITAQDLSTFIQQLFEQAYFRMFAYGNYSNKDAHQLAEIVLAKLPRTFERSKPYQTPIIATTNKQTYNWQQNAILPDIGLLEAYLVPNTDTDLGAARILSQLIRPALFKQLRTTEQLAYGVDFGGETLQNQMILAFEIQSTEKGLAEVFSRIAHFKQGFTKQLDEVSPQDFNNLKLGILASMSQQAKSLAEQMGVYIEDWGYQRWDFSSKQRLISALEKVTLEDVRKLYARMLEDNEFTRVLVQMRGTKFSKQVFIEPLNAINITDIDSFHQQNN